LLEHNTYGEETMTSQISHLAALALAAGLLVRERDTQLPSRRNLYRPGAFDVSKVISFFSNAILLSRMARPERFEHATSTFGALAKYLASLSEAESKC
jgi:hypothetical protein